MPFSKCGYQALIYALYTLDTLRVFSDCNTIKEKHVMILPKIPIQDTVIWKYYHVELFLI